MTFAARVVAGMADMLAALIFKVEPGRAKRGIQPLDHFAGDGSGGSVGHRSYIEAFEERDTSGDTADEMAWQGRGRQCSLLRSRLPPAGRVPGAGKPTGL
jgi:hypothetical protein